MNSAKKIIIIGAGPSGAVASAFLTAKGYQVDILERQQFPRFSIGESLLPQCMAFLEEANMLDAVMNNAEQYNFQYKNGAAFAYQDKHSEFDFRQKFSAGPGTTYQVERAYFDLVLAQEAERQGATMFWGHTVTGIQLPKTPGEPVQLEVDDESGKSYQTCADFVLDASGFGRVLPRLLKLDQPSDFPSRSSLFTHVQDNIDTENNTFDRNKILITVHHQHRDVWFWTIPFGKGKSSVGVVARSDFFENFDQDSSIRLKQILDDEPSLKRLLKNAEFTAPARQISGYASNVSALHGPGFALLGNAGEFLDPVFSSGVTIAMKSAKLSTDLLHRQFQGESCDWQQDYATPLRQGVDTFRHFVEAWYDGRFQDIIFSTQQSDEIRKMISSILAGYAWDSKNPYVRDSERRINTLAEHCRLLAAEH